MPRLSSLAIACAALMAAIPAAARPPVATDLGRNNAVQSVSDDGAVVVGIALNIDDPQATGVTRWTAATGTQPIGGLSVGRPTVSADGRTIAGTVMTDREESAFWTSAEGWRPLGELGLIPPMPGWATSSLAISANGERLAGATVPPPVDYGHVRAFSFNPDTFEDRWADYGWQELPLTRKGSVAEASGISDDGLIQVGRSTDLGGAYRAVRWSDGRVSELLDGQRRRLGGESVRCSRDCRVIVGGGGGSSAVDPVLAWRILPAGRAPACYLAPLSGPRLPALRYYAFDTSDSGGVVIGTYYYDEVPADGGFSRNVAKGFIWIGNDTGGTMHDLQTYLQGLGQPFLDGWLNVVATGLSADGRYLVGHGDDAQGVARGWRIAFGGVPRATGPDADRTICPTSRATDVSPPGVAAKPLTREQQYRDTPSGQFRGAGARSYMVQTRGGRVYGGSRRDRLGALLWLGGDHYYDAATRTRRSFERDRNGLVVGMTERMAGRAAVHLRRTGD